MDSLDWEKVFPVVQISRSLLYDQPQLGFTTEEINSLSDEDMQMLTDKTIEWFNNFVADEFFLILEDILTRKLEKQAEGKEQKNGLTDME